MRALAGSSPIGAEAETNMEKVEVAPPAMLSGTVGASPGRATWQPSRSEALVLTKLANAAAGMPWTTERPPARIEAEAAIGTDGLLARTTAGNKARAMPIGVAPCPDLPEQYDRTHEILAEKAPESAR